MGDQRVGDRDLVSWWGLVKEGFLTTHRFVDRTVEHELGIQPAPAEVLLRLIRTPGYRLPLSRIAREIDLSSGGFTKVADKLIAQRLIARVPDARDRRVIWAELTVDGIAKGRAVQRVTAAVLREHALAVLGAERTERLGADLRELRDANR